MKVYTHFYPAGSDSKEGYRWRTLLHFGCSWNIIGSVVMKNPGSSQCISSRITDERILFELLKFDNSCDEWFEFDIDSTMRKVGDLFAYKYDKKHRENLNGVIQIFNLFYIKDPDLNQALQKDKNYKLFSRFSTPDEIADYDITHLKSPVYLGFSTLAQSPAYGARAERFYNAVISPQLGMRYLKIFSENKFRHPLWLMGVGSNTFEAEYIRRCFKENTTSPKDIEALRILYEQRDSLKREVKRTCRSLSKRLTDYHIWIYEKFTLVVEKANIAIDITYSAATVEITVQNRKSAIALNKNLEKTGFVLNDKRWKLRRYVLQKEAMCEDEIIELAEKIFSEYV